jgi:hypothetical protein
MRTQIVVEGNTLDLTQELDASLTYAIDDVAKFSARNTSFSKTIVVPGSAQNNFVFGNIFDVAVYNDYSSGLTNVGYNYNATKSAGCIVYQDNIQVLKGVLRVLEISIVNGVIEYECAVFGELGGLISNLGDKLLEVLDFSSDNHALNAASVTGSWASSGLSYYYPVIDYGYTWDGINFDVADLRPAIYAKAYLDKMFTAAGYTYASTFLDSASFNKLIIPNNTDANYIEITDLFNRTYSGSPVAISTDPWTPTYNTSIGTQYATESSGTVTYSRAQTINVNVTASMLISATNPTGSGITLTLRLYKNGADTGVGQTVTVNAGATYNGTLQFASLVSLATGNTLSLRLTSSNFAGFSVKNQIAAQLKAGSATSLKINMLYGDNVVMNGQIPKGVKQIDFLTSLIKMFNLFITEDKDTDKLLNIKPQPTYYDSGNFKDWTAKLDYSQPIKVKPLGELNSRSYEFKYKDDADYYNDLYKRKYGVSYGSNTYDTGFEFANDRSTTELIFSPTVMVSVSGNNIIAPAIHKVTNNVKEKIGSNIRILYSKTSTPTSVINLKNGGTTVVSGYSSYGYAGHFDDPQAATLDLNWGAPNEVYFTSSGGYPSRGLFNEYWSGYLAEVTFKDSKIMTAFFNLTAVDIQTLDFSKLIFIGGQLWRLNKVIDYNTLGKEMTKCELTNVINL